MSKHLIKTALGLLRRRFIDVSAQHFPKELAEHELILYHAKKLFDSTVVGGKNKRSLLSLNAFEALYPDADKEVKEVAAQAAATLEMIQAFYLIADDIMDQSDTRRGNSTWHMTPGIGLSAVNDAFLLDVGALEILRQLYPAHPQLNLICDAYNRSKKITVVGQFLDTATQGHLKSFTWERYEQLVQHKTSHYTIFHPIEQALLICDMLKGHSILRKIAYRIGFLFQAQDDILDVFGDPSLTGKTGTDLRDAKCTFVTTRAIEKLTSKNLPQLSEFETNFGKKDEKSVLILRQIAGDLKIKEEFQQLQTRMAESILTDLEKLPMDIQPLAPVLDNYLRTLLNRTK